VVRNAGRDGFSGPGGGDFTGLSPLTWTRPQSLSSNWLQSTVDPSVRWAPRSMYTFQILRDEPSQTVQMTTSQRQPFSRQFGVTRDLEFQPGIAAPSNYSGNIVTVEFWFEFRR